MSKPPLTLKLLKKINKKIKLKKTKQKLIKKFKKNTKLKKLIKNQSVRERESSGCGPYGGNMIKKID